MARKFHINLLPESLGTVSDEPGNTFVGRFQAMGNKYQGKCSQIIVGISQNTLCKSMKSFEITNDRLSETLNDGVK